MSSGTWAGRAAARRAAAVRGVAGRRRLYPVGGAGLRPTGPASTVDHREVREVIAAQVHPYDRNYLRHGDRLAPALAALDEAWARLRTGLGGDGGDPVPARQAAAMLAHARWMYTSALTRTESRGMHKREDHPATDPRRWHRQVTGGLDEVWVRAEPLLALAVA
jgi:succinate dehydrogenase/fumarate reductase flavoprotein subunit